MYLKQNLFTIYYLCTHSSYLRYDIWNLILYLIFDLQTAHWMLSLEIKDFFFSPNSIWSIDKTMVPIFYGLVFQLVCWLSLLLGTFFSNPIKYCITFNAISLTSPASISMTLQPQIMTLSLLLKILVMLDKLYD